MVFDAKAGKIKQFVTVAIRESSILVKATRKQLRKCHCSKPLNGPRGLSELDTPVATLNRLTYAHSLFLSPTF